MGKERVLAFSDGVIAIIITIMVLELKVPHGVELSALRELVPVFFSYVLSFCYVAIYRNNHHHLLGAVESIDASVMWANSHLLFWLSLVPFATGWMSESHFAVAPTVVYGIVLVMAAIAYYILQLALVRVQGRDGRIAAALGRDVKGKGSIVAYIVAIAAAIYTPWIAIVIYVLVALAWLIPDRRMESAMKRRDS